MHEYSWLHVAPWGPELAVYFFVVGTAAMTFILAAAPNVFGGAARTLEPARFPGALVALVLLALCGPLLIHDLAQPGRFLYPIIYFHASSPLSWGALLLVLFGFSALVFAYAAWSGNGALMRPVAIIGSLLALTMPLYTGIDLMANQARELWNSASVPALFVVLSVTSGAAVMALVALVRGATDESSRLLRGVLLASLGATLVIFVAEWIRMAYGSEELLAAWAFINAEMAARFWGLTLVVGIVAPLVLLLVPGLGNRPAVVAIAGIAGAVGAFTFREVILYAGQMAQLYY